MNALDLADALEAEPDCTCHAACYIECSCDAIWPEQYTLTAADELRRLHTQRDALLEALKNIERSTYDAGTAALARAAIAKVEEKA